MTADREQTRRDAEALLAFDLDGQIPGDDFDVDGIVLARHTLALLAELEQAEQREAALVEALRFYAERVTDGIRARGALAAYEQEQHV